MFSSRRKVSLRLTLRRYLEQISPNNFVVVSSFSCCLLCVTRTSIFPFFCRSVVAACVDLVYFRLSPATISILAYLLDDKAPGFFFLKTYLNVLLCFLCFLVFFWALLWLCELFVCCIFVAASWKRKKTFLVNAFPLRTLEFYYLHIKKDQCGEFSVMIFGEIENGCWTT